MGTAQINPIRKGTTRINYYIRDQLLHPGDRVGHCRVIELIAAGGMANVYKVWHEQLEVVRALKILKPGYTEESKGRLETEAKIAANLQHNNIVENYGVGYWHTVPYIEMEYVDGPSLKNFLDSRTRLSIPLSLAVTHYLCVALQFAYNQSMTLYGKVYDRLIHRDIKPANILISSKGIVKLADFGIARPSEVSIHTVDSKIMGTFAYLSPEQLSGEILDQRSDIYALGAVLYEMISGVKTFPQKILPELVQKKSKGYYAPIDSFGIQAPKAVIDTIDKCLHVDKNKRYQNLAEVDKSILAALKRISTKSPNELLTTILTESDTTSIEAPGSKRKMLLVIILLLIISSGSVWLLVSNIKKRSLTKQSTSSIKTKPLLADSPKTDSPPSTNPSEPASSQQASSTSSQQTSSAPSQQTSSAPSQQTSSAPSQQTSSAPSQQTSRAPSQQTSRAPSQQTRGISSQQARQTSSPTAGMTNVENQINKGISLYSTGDYGEAVTLLSNIPTNSINSALAAKINVTLIKCYIKMKHYNKAVSLAEQETFDSPEYYYYSGVLHDHFGEAEKASKVLQKALLLNIADTNLRQRIHLLKAQISEKQYKLKPNAINMKMVSDDWKSFIDCCCTGSTQNASCLEAQEKVKQYSF